MMDSSVKELMESGLLEVYALGMATDEEANLVKRLLQSSEEARNELKEIQQSLNTYSEAFKESPYFHTIKNQLTDQIRPEALPILNEFSTVEEWIHLLDEKNIYLPKETGPIYFREISEPFDNYTYVISAKPGVVIPDEVHDEQDEYLLICSGSCEMVVEGVKTFHEAGSFIHVVPNVQHFGKVTGNEMLLAIGQRRKTA
jgi:quercetin dioxygenase-like cupin family protein